MVTIGGAHALIDLLLIFPLCLVFFENSLAFLFAHHRKYPCSNGLVRSCQSRLSHLAQKLLLALDHLDVVEILLLDMLFRLGSNATNDLQEEINEAIGDFSGSLLTKGSKQSITRRFGMPTQFVGSFGCRSLSIEGDDFGRDACEEIGRQSKLHQNAELINLVEDTFQSNRTRIGFQVLPGDGSLTGGRRHGCWLIIESLFFLLGRNLATCQEFIEQGSRC